MAGRGPAPKEPDQRRRGAKPQRGEWVDISAPARPVLPTLTSVEKGRKWDARTRRAWEAWRQDAATSMYGPAEVAAAIELAYLFDDFVVYGPASAAPELRLRMDGLGLTPKGKRDLRWRVVDEELVVEAPTIDDEIAARRREREERRSAR